MKIRYFTSQNEKEIILGDGDQYVIREAEEIKIIFQSDNQENIFPFKVKIIDTYNTFNKIILPSVTIGVFVLLVILLIVFIIWKKRRKRIFLENLNNFNGNNVNQFYINNINTINNDIINNTDRIGLMNYINQLKPIKFKEIKNQAKNTKCPIDMENLEPDSDVIFTECLHLFHYDCLKMYFEKNSNLKEFKCPLCNHTLYTTKINVDNDLDNGTKFQK